MRSIPYNIVLIRQSSVRAILGPLLSHVSAVPWGHLKGSKLKKKYVCISISTKQAENFKSCEMKEG